MVKSSNIAIHSHVRSLGLDDCGNPVEKPDAVIGQENAREAAGLIVEMVRTKRMSGRAVLISGPVGSGKTALAVGISEELGAGTPFTSMSGSEVYSNEVKKTEVLEEALRRSILVRMRELKDVYEGEVVELRIVDEENPLSSYPKRIKEMFVILKTSKESKKLKLAPSLYEQIDKQRIVNGDVVYIEVNSGVIKKLGRSEAHMNDFDLEADTYVPIPKGEVLKRKEVMQSVTLHDLDMANARPSGQDMLSLVFRILSPRKTEITERLRGDVNRMVNGYLENGNAEIVPGVLFIDEVHMLDVECFTFLHKVIESPLSPTIIFASNKGMAPIKGSDGLLGPFGITKDLLDRIVIISVKRNPDEANREIIRRRMKEEGLEMDDDAFGFFVGLSTSRSLRYCISLIPLLKTYGGCVSVRNVEEVAELFHDS
ncbi:DNA helicase domain [Encephalitozoon cuniculi GB-M1]|uniref:RuvB-like protein 1 n=2 Tax=Encephalitozoon cuniculi TaxID=6035 RepID=RUVB1_ENCCU|nr:RuvB family ATP-dependent DNA helicase pontin [Encephalitozoon cuniculi GB-M1]Q8STP2.1 RecName: Full=RuvB-like protein 1; Short=RUVBL1; AltName: Full=TIP49-homology protein 1; AltName: Full=TIP49a homolog [Encephalitozoon cuniculi GB-M1]AGE96504.1 DNA helicase domain containing protein [Encephalitozoon cuniculi]KMV65408.1 DNA helicase TIP49 [Encephalitozoon cuniculi EcunIII-L]UYI26828.1 RuvB-like helicase 2 [Encephalitozoon cuniculi]CAD27111.1 DNA helicase domain [Encephalitozoon cuniculi G